MPDSNLKEPHGNPVLPRLFLKPKEEDRILEGHPWIYDNEVKEIRTGKQCFPFSNSRFEYTGLMEAYTASGFFLGIGYYNHFSKIIFRFFSRERDEINGEFFSKRIKTALELRKNFFSPGDSFRLVFGEADFLPGLIVDCFKAFPLGTDNPGAEVTPQVFLSIQFLSRAVEEYRDLIIDALRKILNPVGIVERSDVRVRVLEGLEEKKGFIGPEFNPEIIIRENSILLKVNLLEGQKTGYFLDQKFNRRLLSPIVSGKRVLDTFTHTGAFGLNASLFGAAEVISADISPEAVALTKENIILNHSEKTNTVLEADVFELLKSYCDSGETFDVIILDPPAFTKNAKTSSKAYGGYKEINLRAMKILKTGGYLLTCSCSHFFTDEMFMNMLLNAGRDAHKKLQIISRTGPGPDHPVLAGYPESSYLTCVLLRVF